MKKSQELNFCFPTIFIFISSLRFHNGLTHNLDKMSYALQNMYRHVPDHILNARIARPIAVGYITVFLIWPKLTMTMTMTNVLLNINTYSDSVKYSL